MRCLNQSEPPDTENLTNHRRKFLQMGGGGNKIYEVLVLPVYHNFDCKKNENIYKNVQDNIDGLPFLNNRIRSCFQ